ncbi:MAG: acetyl-CoA carboxylase biotin carboxylase subunit [Pseudomonadota bacterium]
MIKTLLIANRGEIACRIAKTAKRLGVRVVAVYSEADADAGHVAIADVAVAIGPAAPRESYLRIDKIIDAAKKTGADAIHPGYGFLSENADFAEACAEAGIIFVGPKSNTIRLMGSKSAAKDLMRDAGVPIAPGYQGADQDPATFKKSAAEIGYPVLLKAAAGGGGKGMRLVEREADLDAALDAAKREALSAFGDDQFLVEKYIANPRHVEVQVFGDAHGNVVHLFERDCSLQRRHQKIIEEAPAPGLPPAVRARLHQAAIDAAKAVEYVGAGTVEFLYDGAEAVYFMEMNTRLQVEHPVTEMITGVDLVEWQLTVAAGGAVPLVQDNIIASGAAVEARLYAEDADNGFLPSVGTLERFVLPLENEELRIDCGVGEGDAVSPNYDPMIAKMIAGGDTREEALSRLNRALGETRIAGLETNVRLLHALTAHEDFIAGALDTHFIEDRRDTLFERAGQDDRSLIAACLFLMAEEDACDDDGVFTSLAGWRMNAPTARFFRFDEEGAPRIVAMERRADGDVFLIDDRVVLASGSASADGAVTYIVDGVRGSAFAARTKSGVRVWIGADPVDFVLWRGLEGASGATAGGTLTAPMPGLVTAIAHAAGDRVAAGETLLVMEAMKMEHAVVAPSDGVVTAYRFAPGDQVGEGDLLVDFDADDG